MINFHTSLYFNAYKFVNNSCFSLKCMYKTCTCIDSDSNTYMIFFQILPKTAQVPLKNVKLMSFLVF